MLVGGRDRATAIPDPHTAGILCHAADRALGRGPGAAYSNLKTSSSPTHDCVGWSRNLVVFCLPAQKDRMSVVSVALVDFKT